MMFFDNISERLATSNTIHPHIYIDRTDSDTYECI